ncbi:MAG: DUF3352 domain-containing protein [Gaiellales bacterium]
MRRTLLLRFALAALTVPVALTAAGCGSGSKAGSGDAAQAIPSGALLYAGVNLDHGSTAWKRFTQVGSRFPGWDGIVSNLQQTLDHGNGKLVFSKDIEPWLGTQAAVAVTSINADQPQVSPNVVAYLASSDDGKARSALERSGGTKIGSYKGYDEYRDSQSSQSFAGVGHGAVLLGTTRSALEQAIDTREGDGSSLAQDAGFRDAIARLPADQLVQGYVNTPRLAQLLSLASLSGATPTPSATPAQLKQVATMLAGIKGVGFGIGADDHGYRFTAVAALDPSHPNPALTSASQFAPSLTHQIPADAFAYLGIRDLGQQIQRAIAPSGSPQTQQGIQQFEQATGLSITTDLVPLLSGEQALYLAPGLPLRGALVLHPSDPARSAVTMRRIIRALGWLGSGVRVMPLPGGEGQRFTLKGVPFRFQWQRSGNLIAIGNDPAAPGTPGAGLATASKYTQILQEAGVPAKVGGILYVDIPGALNAFPSQVDVKARALGGFVVWQSVGSGEYRLGAYLEVK